MGEWISVKDRMPDEKIDVIILMHPVFNCQVFRASFFDGNWYDIEQHFLCTEEDATHWIPIPSFSTIT